MTALFDTNSQYEYSEAKASVRLNSGDVILVELPTRKAVEIGQSIEFDILESERKKLIYRLTETPNQP